MIMRLRALVIEEAGQVQGFLRLLMKPRNGRTWSAEDRRRLREGLRRMGRVMPVLGLLALPGGSLLIPLLAWFLDRRRSAQLRFDAERRSVAAADDDRETRTGTR